MVVSFQVLDHFQTYSGPLHHQLWLLWPHLPLQHGCLWGGDPEELQLAGHWGSAGTPKALEGGSGGSRALLPAGSHLGLGIPHQWHLLHSHALPFHHPQLFPRSALTLSWVPWAWVGKMEEAGASLGVGQGSQGTSVLPALSCPFFWQGTSSCRSQPPHGDAHGSQLHPLHPWWFSSKKDIP